MGDKRGGQGAAGSEGHCPKALMEYLLVTEPWGLGTVGLEDVQGSKRQQLCASGHRDEACSAPAALLRSLNCPQTTSPFSFISFLVRRLQGENAERKHSSSLKHHLDSSCRVGYTILCTWFEKGSSV